MIFGNHSELATVSFSPASQNQAGRYSLSCKRLDICDNLATFIIIGTESDKTVKLLSDNTKHKNNKSNANPISRSHTDPLLPQYSFTRVTVNGHSIYKRW